MAYISRLVYKEFSCSLAQISELLLSFRQSKTVVHHQKYFQFTYQPITQICLQFCDKQSVLLFSIWNVFTSQDNVSSYDSGKMKEGLSRLRREKGSTVSQVSWREELKHILRLKTWTPTPQECRSPCMHPTGRASFLPKGCSSHVEVADLWDETQIPLHEAQGLSGSGVGWAWVPSPGSSPPPFSAPAPEVNYTRSF